MIPRDAGKQNEDYGNLSESARSVLLYLRQRGASFFADIVRGTKMIKAETETALWELVTAGMITADGFDNIRAMVDPRRRAGKGRGCIPRAPGTALAAGPSCMLEKFQNGIEHSKPCAGRCLSGTASFFAKFSPEKAWFRAGASF